MTIDVFDRGQLVRVYLTVATTTGPVDPSPLKATYWPTSASSTTLVSLTTTGSSLVNSTAGSWYFDVLADVEGTWQWEWESTAGNYRGSKRGQFRIIDDVFG